MYSVKDTYPHFGLHPLGSVGKPPSRPVLCIRRDGIVGPCPGWLLFSLSSNQAREIFPDQKSKDAVDMSRVLTTPNLNPMPAEWKAQSFVCVEILKVVICKSRDSHLQVSIWLNDRSFVDCNRSLGEG